MSIKKPHDNVVNFNVTTEEKQRFTDLVAIKNEIFKDADISTNKNASAIFVSPEVYFNKYLSSGNRTTFEKIMTFTQYCILSHIYDKNSEDIISKIKDLRSTSLNGIRDKILQFLNYSLNVLETIVKSGNDIILDGYNEKILSNKSFRVLIESHNFCMESFKQDKQDLSEAIESIKSTESYKDTCGKCD